MFSRSQLNVKVPSARRCLMILNGRSSHHYKNRTREKTEQHLQEERRGEEDIIVQTYYTFKSPLASI